MWKKNDLVRVVPGPEGTVKVWRKPTKAELTKWIRDTRDDPNAKAPRVVCEDARPEEDDLLAVAEEISMVEGLEEAPGPLCRILDLSTGALFWVARDSVVAV